MPHAPDSCERQDDSAHTQLVRHSALTHGGRLQIQGKLPQSHSNPILDVRLAATEVSKSLVSAFGISFLSVVQMLPADSDHPTRFTYTLEIVCKG